MRYVLAFILGFGLMWLLSTCAEARWVGPPQQLADMTVVPGISGWFIGLSNQRGNSCCSDADGNQPEAVWDNTDNPNYPYKVKIEGEWVEVPAYAVIKGPNRVGIAIVWYYKSWGNDPKFIVRCFLPGSLI